MHRGMRLVSAALGVAVFAGRAVDARAGGLFAGDSGSQAQERAGAFVAKADDPTALFHNPAGLVKARSTEITININAVDYSQTFQRSGTYAAPTDGTSYPYTGQAYPEVSNSGPILPVPMLAGTQRWQKFGFGEGISGPQADPNREYQRDVTTANGATAPSPERYDVLSQRSLIVLPSVGVAYRILDWLDVGARASWGFGSIQATSFTWGFGNTEEDIGKDGEFRIDAADNFIPAWGAGVLARPTDFLEFGAAYSSSIRVQAKGNGIAILGPKLASLLGGGGMTDEIVPLAAGLAPGCAPGGTDSMHLKACIDVALPQVATLGGRYIVRDGLKQERADIELDVRWENWSQKRDIGNRQSIPVGDVRVVVDGQDKVSGIPLNPSILKHHFEDVLSVRLGGQYRLAVAKQDLIIRAGLAYDTAAAPTSWTREDLDGAARFTTSFGLALQHKKWRFDLGGAAILEADRTVTQVNVGTMPTVAARQQPDPIQPLISTDQQEYDPINNGKHSSHYLIITGGVTTWF